MTLWALVHARSGELLSLAGAVIAHGDRAELEFLVPHTRTVTVPPDLGRPILLIKDHPQFASVRWPLRREDFW